MAVLVLWWCFVLNGECMQERGGFIRLLLFLRERGDVVEPSAGMGVLLGIWGRLDLSKDGGVGSAHFIATMSC